MSDHGEEKQRSSALTQALPVDSYLETNGARQPVDPKVRTIEECDRDVRETLKEFFRATCPRCAANQIRGDDHCEQHRGVYESLNRLADVAQDIWDGKEAADAWDGLNIDAARERIAKLENLVLELAGILQPFADAGKRFHVTGDGTHADAFRDVTPEQLREAWKAVERSWIP